MTPLLPPRCTATSECAGQRHWTQQSREECLRRQEKARQEKPATLEPVGLSWVVDKEKASMEEAIARHVPQAPPAGSADAELLDTGKKQLLFLGPEHIQAANLLLTYEIYTINQRLRAGRSLEGLTTGAAGDWEGVGYKQTIVDNADDGFASLGPGMDLDSPVRMFRRISVPQTPNSEYPDIAGVHSHLQNGTPLPSVFLDAGYLFAVTDPTTAMGHGDNNYTAPHIPKFPVLLELEVRRALCIPDYKYRSKELYRHCYPSRYLRESSGQVIIPRDSKWEVLGFQATSRYNGVPLMKMRQL
ncbi:hypothetical protein [Arthrobacter koreensis]|uniref:hypothetical protein n=1 Tax=Arthrobacter koreensis TaxID=199136 RepID=UPI00381D2A50